MYSASNIGYICPIPLYPISICQSNLLMNNYPNYAFYPPMLSPMPGIPTSNIIQTELNNNIQQQNSTNHDEADDFDFKTQRRKFTQEEDERLKMLVDRMGCRKWTNIAKYMPGRTGRQCRDRYQNYLIPGYFTGQWTKEEDELLLKKYNEMGSQWSKMTAFFENRNANAIKNRWYYYISKHKNDLDKNRNNKKSDVEISGIPSIIDYAFSLSFIDQIEDKNDSSSSLFTHKTNLIDN